MPPSATRAARRIAAAVPLVLAACRRRTLPAPEAPAGVSPHLAGLLEHLDPSRPTAAGELARRLGVTPGTISLQIARLIALRLVSRTPDRADGRRALLRLTAAGVRLRERRTLLDPECVRLLLQRLSPRERDLAVQGIESLGRAAQALGPRPAEPSRPAPLTRRSLP